MKRIFTLKVSVLVALFGCAGVAHASTITTSGAILRGISDVSYAIPASANSYAWGLHSDDPLTGASTRTPGHGSTSPDTTFSHFFAGESVLNDVFFAPDHALSSGMQVDIANAGDINGKVNHVRLDANIDDASGIHRRASSAVNATFDFSGGPVINDTPWVIYYAFQWQITTNILANPGAAMDFNLNFGGGADPGGGVDPIAGAWHTSYGNGSLSGSAFGGSFGIDQGNWRLGDGSRTIQFAFDAVNGAGSSNPGGHAALDVWFAFSSTPFTVQPDLAPEDSSALPEPASYLQILLGLGAVGGIVRRKLR